MSLPCGLSGGTWLACLGALAFEIRSAESIRLFYYFTFLLMNLLTSEHGRAINRNQLVTQRYNGDFDDVIVNPDANGQPASASNLLCTGL